MKLEIGCGYRESPGCVRMDLNPNAADLDLVGAAIPLPFADGAFTEVHAVDVLEHLPYRQTLDALVEWRRVLAPAGVLYVQVPDCGLIMREWVTSPGRWRERLPAELADLPPLLGVTWRIMGGQDDGSFSFDGDDWRLNSHYAMFDEATLRWYLTQAGLHPVKIETNHHPNLLCWAQPA